MSTDSTRRDFLKTSAVAGGALAVDLSLLSNVHAQGNDTIRVGLVGCGNRGSGAIEQCLNADNNVRLVAVGDTFRARATSLLARLRGNQAAASVAGAAGSFGGFRAKVDVPADRIFVGLEAYTQVIQNCDLVILATPPGFRPIHLRAAVAARKHIFTEKPVAVDGPGVRICLAAHEEANRHNLTIVAGTQRRYQTGYLQAMQRVHDGAIGTITSGRCYWNMGGLWHAAREEGMTDIEWQIRNWLYFTWLSGDHICEQHVHNLDVCNWAIGAHPVRCTGMGGRQVRTEPQFGHIFDHFAVDYEYPHNVHVLSMCRQTVGASANVSEAVTGTRGALTTNAPQKLYQITGERPWTLPRASDNEPYQAEHVALFESIRGRRRQRINDLRQVAESTLTAIMGRMSAYTGQNVTWEQALNSQLALMPERLTWDMSMPTPAVAVPGRTPLT
jgi:myo-inositol 2-dehydrogenase / D-chiro-inositol 1-dehydrogenase